MGVTLIHPGIGTMKAVEDDDDGETYDIWDIIIKDVKRIKRFFNVPDETDEVIQPLIPQPIHITPPIDDYVESATKSILDELLEYKILNVTMVDTEANFNPINDIEELERFLAKEPQSHFTQIHVHSVITKLEPFIHTRLMNPLYRIFESYKSSTKPYKVDREMKSPSRFSLQRDVIRGCYSSCKKASQTKLVRCYIGDDELLESGMLLVEVNLEHGLEHVVSSSYQANPGEFIIPILLLSLIFIFLNVQ
ncbi:hypothetical protein Tco_0412658 [Tanacetum coccineum]